MADGTLELVGVPTTYGVRHIPHRRKGAQVTYVCEQSVLRVPSWTSQQAPVVIRADVDYPDRVEVVEYRAARCSDGSVRLVCDITSAGHEWNAYGQNDNPFNLPDYRRVCLFHMPNNKGLNIGYHIMPGHHLDGSTILSSQRRAGLEHTNSVQDKLVIIDGRLHGACHEPGWALDYSIRWQGHVRVPHIASAHVSPDIGDCGRMGSEFMPFCREPMAAIARAYPDVLPENTARVRPGITEVVAGALGADQAWRELGRIAGLAVHNDASLVSQLFDEELAARRRIVAAMAMWPTTRNAGLLDDTARFVRTIHGIKNAGNAPMLKMLQDCLQYLHNNPAPMDLESRLDIAGLQIPQMPQDGPQPMRRNP